MVQFGLTVGSFVVMFAVPTASYEPITLVPAIVVVLDRPSITPWTVSEPTPESWRNVGDPDGSALATVAPSTAASKLAHTAMAAIVRFTEFSPQVSLRRGGARRRSERLSKRMVEAMSAGITSRASA